MTAEQAFDNYHKAIYRFVYRLSGRADIAEDITQDCFLAILRDPQRWNERRGDFRTYLFSIARNLAFKRYRDDHGSLYVDEDEAVLAAPRQADQELSVTVAQMVAQLPDLQREVLILFEYEGFSLNEIALIVNADVGAVKARLHRARERLRQTLTPFNAKGMAASRQTTQELSRSSGGELDTVPVLREFLESAKGTAASRQTTQELSRSSGGELDTVPVLREFLEKGGNA